MRNLSYHKPPMKLNVEKYVERENPFNLSLEEIIYFFDNPNYFEGKSLKNKKDVEYIRKKTKEYLDKYPNGLKR